MPMVRINDDVYSSLKLDAERNFRGIQQQVNWVLRDHYNLQTRPVASSPPSLPPGRVSDLRVADLIAEGDESAPVGTYILNRFLDRLSPAETSAISAHISGWRAQAAQIDIDDAAI
jgi:hypothetical protein